VHAWVGFVDEHDNLIDPDHRRVTLMCGLGNPRAFIQQAHARFILAESRVFADHHDYTTADLADLPACDAVLTTDKDYVKLRRLLESRPLSVPVWRPKLEIRWLDGEAAVAERLAAVAQCDRPL
jgi:tetraacyldisaccharide 4'-kinase